MSRDHIAWSDGEILFYRLHRCMHCMKACDAVASPTPCFVYPKIKMFFCLLESQPLAHPSSIDLTTFFFECTTTWFYMVYFGIENGSFTCLKWRVSRTTVGSRKPPRVFCFGGLFASWCLHLNCYQVSLVEQTFKLIRRDQKLCEYCIWSPKTVSLNSAKWTKFVRLPPIVTDLAAFTERPQIATQNLIWSHMMKYRYGENQKETIYVDEKGWPRDWTQDGSDCSDNMSVAARHVWS